MKKITMWLMHAGLCLLCTRTLGAATLYDDFGTSYVKKALWKDHYASGSYLHDLVREIDTDNHVLVLKIGTNEHTDLMRNSMGLRNSATINQVRVDVKVVAVNSDDSDQPDEATVFARISGSFYNKDFASPSDNVGDIFAELCIGDKGNGLEAWYTVEEQTGNTDTDYITHVHQVLASNLDLNKFYTLDHSYDDDHGFVFQIYDGTIQLNSVSYSAPARMGACVQPGKALAVCVHDFPGEYVDDFIHAEFDNLYINGSATAHETFDGDSIDQTKWNKWVCLALCLRRMQCS